MDTTAIGGVFAASTILAVGLLWLHRRLSGQGEQVRGVSLVPLAFGLLFALTAVITGGFLLMLR